MTELYKLFDHQILIGGCPRSGTTLLGKELSIKVGALFVPESQFKIDLIQWYEDDNDLETVIQKLLSHPRLAIWEVDKEKVKEMRFPAWTPNLIYTYLCRVYQNKIGQSEANIVIDHTPENIIHYPKCRNYFNFCNLIHIYRDPRAVYNSVKGLDWGPNNVKSFYVWWIKNFSLGLLMERTYSSEVVNVKFEEFVMNPEESIKILLLKINLIIKGKLEKSNITIPKYTQNQHKLLSGSPSVLRILGWEKELKSWELVYIETKLGSFLSALNYPRSSISDFELNWKHSIIIFLQKNVKRYFNKLIYRNKLKKMVK